LGYEPNELPGCSTPQYQSTNWQDGGQMMRSPDSARIRYTGVNR
jgi:hypothetical protein